MAPLALKIKGNKSFSPFANLDSEEDLSKTWRVCTKVKDSLENGSRLENLSWRLWFRHHLLTEKSNAPFRKLSRNTARQLDHQNSKLSPLKDSKRPAGVKGKVEETAAINAQQSTSSAPEQSVNLLREEPEQHNNQHVGMQCQEQQNEMTWSAVQPQPETRQHEPTGGSSSSNLLHDNSISSSNQQMQPISMSTAAIQIPEMEPNNSDRKDQSTQFGQQTFVLHQFTSDQASDQCIMLDDIFGPMGDLNGFLQTGTTASSAAAAAAAIAENIANDTDMTMSFPTQWNINGYSSPVNLYFPSPVPPALPSQRQQRHSQAPMQAAQHPQQAQQQQPSTSSQQQEFARQEPQSQHSARPMAIDSSLLANRLASFSMQQGQQLSFSVPASPVLGPSQHQPHPNSGFDHIVVNHNNNTTSMTDFMRSDGTAASSVPPPPAGPLRNKLFGNIPVPAQSASSPTHIFSSPAFATTSLSTSVSTASSSATNNSSPPPKMSNTASIVDTSVYGGALHLSHPSMQMPERQAHATTPPSSASSCATTPTATAPQKAETATQSTAATTTARARKSTVASSGGEGSGIKPVCSNCGATSTPLWRRSANDELLCNACGLYQKLHNAPRPKTLKPHNGRKDAREDEASQLVCSNCSTTTTPLWRRDESGSPLCNACGLYLKLHHERRPLSMKTDVIKKRQRYESGSGNNGGRKSGKKSKGDQSQPPSPPAMSEPIQMVNMQQPTPHPGSVFLDTGRHFALNTPSNPQAQAQPQQPPLAQPNQATFVYFTQQQQQQQQSQPNNLPVTPVSTMSPVDGAGPSQYF